MGDVPTELSPTRQCAWDLIRFLDQHRAALSPMLILTHDYPDPDALAAAMALKHLAEKRFNIEAKIAYGGVIGRTENKAMVQILKIPAHKFNRALFKRHRSIALVDTQPAFENNSFRGNRRVALVIDQHPSATPVMADLAIIDPECGATCVITAGALLETGLEIPAPLATALAYGILSDTLDLYRVKREDVIEIYLKVLHHADMKALARIQNPARQRAFFQTLSKGIYDAVAYRQVLVSHLGQVRNPDLVSQAAEFLLTYRRATWTLCTGRYKDRLHVSLRSAKQNVQAGEILRSIFDNQREAGGHGPIAGGSFRVGKNPSAPAWRTAEQQIQTRLAKRLRIPARAEFRQLFQP